MGNIRKYCITPRKFYWVNLAQNISFFILKPYNLIYFAKLHYDDVLIPPYMVKKWASAISPSTSFVFITKFGFEPTRITLNSWETKIRNLQIYIFRTIYGHMVCHF